MVSKILLLAFIVGTASAATSIASLPEKPSEFADKEGCYVWEINDVVPFGTTLTPVGYCYMKHCSTTMLNYASCGVIANNYPECHITDKDLSKPYPECCSQLTCDFDDN